MHVYFKVVIEQGFKCQSHYHVSCHTIVYLVHSYTWGAYCISADIVTLANIIVYLTDMLSFKKILLIFSLLH